MVTLILRPASRADLPLIGTLCARSTSVSEEGIGYPRCEDETELLAELALYDTTLEDGIRVLCDGSGEALGFGGFLVSDADEATYLVGPLLVEAGRTPRIATEALRRLVACPIGGRSLLNYVEEDNVLLDQALRDTGWRPGPAQLEMRHAVTARSGPAIATPPPPPWPVRSLTGVADPLFQDVAELLGRQHRWTSDPAARLADLVKDGYRVAVAEHGRRAAGCVLWIYLDDTDFGRLDYLSVREDCQRRSLGTALTRHVLDDAHRTAGIEHVYLSLDPANGAARRLYQRCGFAETVRSRRYTYDRH